MTHLAEVWTARPRPLFCCSNVDILIPLTVVWDGPQDRWDGPQDRSDGPKDRSDGPGRSLRALGLFLLVLDTALAFSEQRGIMCMQCRGGYDFVRARFERNTDL